MRVLVAPPEYLDPETVKAFRLIGFGGLPKWTDKGCALFIHIDRETIEACRGAIHQVRVELHEVAGCPIIRIDVKVYDRQDDPLHFDCFLNIQNDNDVPAIEALAKQDTMVFHWYDEHLRYQRSSAINWPKEQRRAAMEIIKAAREIVSRTGGGDFDKAKAIFMEANPLN